MPIPKGSFFLSLLGGCSLEGATGPVSGRVAQRKRLACLVLIAAAGRRGVTRDKLIALLWPEADA
ncbi:MAG TPA: hypothetical protein VK864_02950, partial [Longimicrobiales bacterium]|nr:hypothetical protein [Longimicrobiales bacterium]